MPLFGKSKEKYDFYLLIHSLAPFPNKYKSIFIHWQRSAKEGRTKSVVPASEGLGRSAATFPFEEAFHVDCALNQDSKTGLFDKKWLILTIHDGEKFSKSGRETPLGRVVINLADYAAEDDKATMAFTVAANQAIIAQVGECRLLVTLGCRAKGKPPMVLGDKLIQPSSPNSPQDYGSSMASSEVSDEDGELSLKVMLPSGEYQRANPDWRQEAQWRPGAGQQGSGQSTALGRIQEDGSNRNLAGSGSERLRGQPQRTQQSAPPSQPRSSADPGSDADSEDEFLAQAVAAMDGKAAMPTLSPQNSRGSKDDRPPLSAASVPPLKPVRSKRSSDVIPPAMDNQPPLPPAAPSRGKPLFAIKPDGPPGLQSRLKSPVIQPPGNEPELPPLMSRENVILPKVVRKESSSPRGGRLGQPLKAFGTEPSLETPRSMIGASVGKIDPSAVRGGIAPSLGKESKRNSLKTGLEASEPSSRGEEADRDSINSLQSRQLNVQSAGSGSLPLRASSGSQPELPDTPRRGRPNVLAELSQGRRILKREDSLGAETNPFVDHLPGSSFRERPENDEAAGKAEFERVPLRRPRQQGLSSLPDLTRGPPAQPSAIIQDPPASEAKPSGSHHWLDDPENLGVEPSPPSSPVPAYKAVQPVFLPKKSALERLQQRGNDMALPPQRFEASSTRSITSSTGPRSMLRSPTPPSQPVQAEAAAPTRDYPPQTTPLPSPLPRVPPYAAAQPAMAKQASPSVARPAATSLPGKRQDQEPSQRLNPPQSALPTNEFDLSNPFEKPLPSAETTSQYTASTPDLQGQSNPFVTAPALGPREASGPYTAASKLRPREESTNPFETPVTVSEPAPRTAEPAQLSVEPQRAAVDARRPQPSPPPQAQQPPTSAFQTPVTSVQAPTRPEVRPATVFGERPQEGSRQQLAVTPPAPAAAPQAPLTNGTARSLDPSEEGKPDSEVFKAELTAVAALEASVYLVRTSKPLGSGGHNPRNMHAPARRVARTVISLGPEEGTIFGLRALMAIEASADAATDISGQAYWWSNCIHLRWMLWAMCSEQHIDSLDPDLEFDSAEFEWITEGVMPPVRGLEERLFQQLFQYMWSTVLMEGATADQLPGSVGKKWVISPSKEEESVQRWIDAFQMAHRALLSVANAVSAGLEAMLKHKMLTALMRRLDAALFEKMLAGDSDGGTLSRGSFHFSGWKGRIGSGMDRELPMDESTLPFALGGELTFGVGVNLKMAAARWTEWAADIGLRNDKGSPEEGYLLFPKLRATADLLMMPKEALTDRAIRDEVIPGLPLSTICELLSRFRPDDLAQEPLAPGLLDALQSETPPSERETSPTSRGLTGYEPPTESQLFKDKLVAPASLEFDNESEDELDALAEMYDPDKQGHTTERFTFLKELWVGAR